MASKKNKYEEVGMVQNRLSHKKDNVRQWQCPSLLDLLEFLETKELDEEYQRRTGTYRSFERFLNRVRSLVSAFEGTLD